MVSSSYCLKLWLQFPQPDRPTKSVHTLIVLPLGFLFLFCSFFFSPFFLVILPTSGINQGEAVFSQLDSSCNIRAEFRETAGKLAILTHTHTHTHLPFGSWKTSTVPKMFVYSCPGCFDMYAINEGNRLPHSTAPSSEQGLTSSQTSQASSPGREMLGHVTPDVHISLLTRPLCSLTALEGIWEGAGERVDHIKATMPGKCSHVTLEAALAECKESLIQLEQMQLHVTVS